MHLTQTHTPPKYCKDMHVPIHVTTPCYSPDMG